MPKLQCEALLLDMDGTLVDSNAVVDHVLSLFASKYGLELDEVKARAHGMRTIDLMTHYLGESMLAKEEADYFEGYEEENVDGVIAKAGARDLLAAVPEARKALVTSAGEVLARRRMAAAGLPLPETAVYAEDAQPGKPHPLCYELGAARLGVNASRCVAIEDAATGIAAALATGAVVLNVGQPLERAHPRLINITGLDELGVQEWNDNLEVVYVER